MQNMAMEDNTPWELLDRFYDRYKVWLAIGVGLAALAWVIIMS